jgi:hypothetical protein
MTGDWSWLDREPNVSPSVLDAILRAIEGLRDDPLPERWTSGEVIDLRDLDGES